jgi:hypothetical protein
VKEFAIYTALRLGIFVACYALLGTLWTLLFDTTTSLLVWPFLGAIVLSSLISLKVLAPQRERFAAKVEGRARRASAKFEERRAREDTD